ncbi:MAG: FecR family protein [Bacteroidota bacterium]|nr:FecR family protein [Bacteroidota bacterium]
MEATQRLHELAAKEIYDKLSQSEQSEMNKLLSGNPKLKKLYEQIHAFEQRETFPETEFNKEAAFRSISEKIDGERGLNLGLSPTLRRIAAVLLILILSSITGYFIFMNKNESVTIVVSAQNEIKPITLSDGTIVTLNENSELKFPETFAKETRTVKLDGEAYFEVKPGDNKFIIETQSGNITVHGTKFNLRARNKEDVLRVDLDEGKVEFTSVNRKNKKLLTDNESMIYNKKTKKLKSSTVYNRNHSAWKSGALIFENTTLKKVAEDISKFYGITIETDQTAGEIPFSGRYKDLEAADILKAIELTQEVKIDTLKNTIIISAQ